MNPDHEYISTFDLLVQPYAPRIHIYHARPTKTAIPLLVTSGNKLCARMLITSSTCPPFLGGAQCETVRRIECDSQS